MALKQAVAYEHFFDSWQGLLIDVNQTIVKCGCPHCLGGPNCNNIRLEQWTDDGNVPCPVIPGTPRLNRDSKTSGIARRRDA